MEEDEIEEGAGEDCICPATLKADEIEQVSQQLTNWPYCVLVFDCEGLEDAVLLEAGRDPCK